MPQPRSDDLYAPLPPSRKVPIAFNPEANHQSKEKSSKCNKPQSSPLTEMRHAIPGDRASDSGQKHKAKSFKPQEIRGVGLHTGGHGGGVSGSDLSDSNTGSPMSTIDSGLYAAGGGAHSPGQSRYGLDNFHKSRSTDKQLHSPVTPENTAVLGVQRKGGGSNRPKEPVYEPPSQPLAVVEPLYENIPGRKSGPDASRAKHSPRNPPKQRGKGGQRYEYSSDEDVRQDYRPHPPRSKFNHEGPKHPIPTPRSTAGKSAKPRDPVGREGVQGIPKHKQSPRQRIPHNSSQESDITFIDAERSSDIELRLITKGNMSPVEAQPRSSQGKPKRASESRPRQHDSRQSSRHSSRHGSRSSIEELEARRPAADRNYPSAIGDESHFPAHLSSIEEGGYHRNGTVTMTGTIKRGAGTKVQDMVEVQYTLSRKELKSLNRSTKLEEDKTSGGCICGLKKGPHILFLSLIFMPFAFIASLFWSFYIGSLTWYNIFLYLSEEKAWYHRVFICPWLIVFYPVLIVLICLSIAFFGMFKQVSWFLSSWYKEIRDPEKGFFGWLCEKMGVSQLAPYEVVVLDENPMVPQTTGQSQIQEGKTKGAAL